jgi:hypothetical protein
LISLLVSSVQLAILVLCGTVPQFGPGVQVFASGHPLDVPYVASSDFADWDGDGLSDLIVGFKEEGENIGKIALFINSGTSDSPVYTYSTTLQADGSEIQLTGRG